MAFALVFAAGARLNGDTHRFFGRTDGRDAGLGLFTRAAGPVENRAVYLFGPPLKYLGLEFTVFWNAAVGFEVSIFNRSSEQIETPGRYFLAPTAEANHLIALKKENGSVTCAHQSLNFARAAAELEKILREHLNDQ